MSTSARSTTVGREPHLELAERLLSEASAGAGSIVVVRGSAGIGKTRFLDTIRDRTKARSIVTASATNYAAVRAPFGPFADLIAELRPFCPDLVPEGAVDRRLFDRAFGGATEAPEGDLDRRRLFVVLAAALERGSRRTPLSLIIDDAQWADPESIEFLHFLASRVGGMRLTTFAALRDGDDAAFELDLAHSLERFERTTAIELAPLADGAARTFVGLALPQGIRLPGRVVDEICRLGEGNPLFLSELVRDAVAGDGRISLPRNIEQSTRKRLRTLTPLEARTIEAAAAIGRSFELDDLGAVAGLERAEVLAVLRTARDLGFLDEDVSSSSRFVFRHELVRVAISESMFAAERAALHGRIATVLEASGAGPEILADHYRRAGDARRAAAASERAARAALALGAFGSARDRLIDLYQTTLDDRVRAWATEQLGRVYTTLGDAESARKHFREAIAFARAEGNSVDIGELECREEEAAYKCGDVDGAVAAVEGILASTTASPAARFHAHVALATYDAFRPDMVSAREQIAIADGITDGRAPAEEIKLEWARATVMMEDDAEDAWRAPADRALHLAENYAAPSYHAYTAMNYAGMARECGRSDLAKPVLARAIEIADEHGLVFASAYARCEAIDTLAEAGRLDRAYDLIREVIGLQVEATVVRANLTAVALPVLADLGIANRFSLFRDPEILENAFATGEPMRYTPVAASFAYAAALEGRYDEAHGLIDRALDGVGSSHFIATALLMCARFGTPAHIAKAHAAFEGDSGRRRVRAYRHLVEALHFRESDERRAKDAVARALIAAESEGLEMLRAYALEIEGRRSEAVAIYERCGARAHIERLAVKRGELTKREAEVALHVRKGLSNRAIAEVLVLSERTVENHVAAIYAKRGVRTRAEFLTLPSESG